MGLKWKAEYNDSGPCVYEARIEAFASLFAHEVVDFNKKEYGVELDWKKVSNKLLKDWVQKPNSDGQTSHTPFMRYLEYNAWTEEARLQKESKNKLDENFDRTKL